MAFDFPAYRMPPVAPREIDMVPTAFRDAVQQHAEAVGLNRRWGDPIDDATIVYEHRKHLIGRARYDQEGNLTMPTTADFLSGPGVATPKP